MQKYECRVIRPTGAIALVTYGSHPTQSSAIRVAKSLCRDGELAEVWLGDFCVYGEYPETSVALIWPIQDKPAPDPENKSTKLA